MLRKRHYFLFVLLISVMRVIHTFDILYRRIDERKQILFSFAHSKTSSVIKTKTEILSNRQRNKNLIDALIKQNISVRKFFSHIISEPSWVLRALVHKTVTFIFLYWEKASKLYHVSIVWYTSVSEFGFTFLKLMSRLIQ